MKDPLPWPDKPAGWQEKTGGYAKDMTLRDYFAAKVMQGLMADPNILPSPEGADMDNIYAEQAYIYADAMLKARAA